MLPRGAGVATTAREARAVNACGDGPDKAAARAHAALEVPRSATGGDDGLRKLFLRLISMAAASRAAGRDRRALQTNLELHRRGWSDGRKPVSSIAVALIARNLTTIFDAEFGDRSGDICADEFVLLCRRLGGDASPAAARPSKPPEPPPPAAAKPSPISRLSKAFPKSSSKTHAAEARIAALRQNLADDDIAPRGAALRGTRRRRVSRGRVRRRRLQGDSWRDRRRRRGEASANGSSPCKRDLASTKVELAEAASARDALQGELKAMQAQRTSSGSWLRR